MSPPEFVHTFAEFRATAPWDVLVLQDFSQIFWDQDGLSASRAALSSDISDAIVAACASRCPAVVLFETWAYDSGGSREAGLTRSGRAFPDPGAEGLGSFGAGLVEGTRTHADVLRASLAQRGVDTKVAVAPVGRAFEACRIKSPSLWRALFYPADGKHPSPAGSFVAAAVLYGFFRGRLVEDLTGSGSFVAAHVDALARAGFGRELSWHLFLFHHLLG